MNIGDKVSLVAKPTIKGVVVPRPDNSKSISFFNRDDIVWIDTDSIGVAWAYKNEIALEVAPVIETVVAPMVKTAVKPDANVTKKVTKSKVKAPKVSVTRVDFRRLVAVDIIRKQHGKFFTAIFVGKDGVEHTCNGRTGVVKYLKGEVAKQLPDDLLNAFNVKKMAYRNIFLDGISEIRAEGKVFTFDKGA